MSQYELGVLSFVYSGVEKYFPEFIESLEAQTDHDFELLLVNDEKSPFKDLEALLKCRRTQFKINNASGSIANIRKQGIAMALKRGWDGIIFADSDDYFESNRVAVSRELLNDGLLFNDLVLFGNKLQDHAAMLSPHFKDGEKITLQNLEDSNCLGLSNTAVSATWVSRWFERVPNTVLAFDWTLFSMILSECREACFTDRTLTYYRQHERNAASPLNDSEAKILKAINVKIAHYGAMSVIDKKYSQKADAFSRIRNQWFSDPNYKKLYCEKVYQQGKNTLWWESVKSFKEEREHSATWK